MPSEARVEVFCKQGLPGNKCFFWPWVEPVWEKKWCRRFLSRLDFLEQIQINNLLHLELQTFDFFGAMIDNSWQNYFTKKILMLRCLKLSDCPVSPTCSPSVSFSEVRMVAMVWWRPYQRSLVKPKLSSLPWIWRRIMAYFLAKRQRLSYIYLVYPCWGSSNAKAW